MSANQLPNWNSRLHRLIATAPWAATLQQRLEQQPGPTPAIPVAAILLAIASLGHQGHSYQHGRALSVLRELPLKWQKELGLPTRRATSEERNEYGRKRVADINYHKVAYIFHRVIDLLDDGTERGRFVAEMLHHSLPDNAKKCRSVAIDGTFHDAFVAHHPRNRLLEDERFDVDYHIRRDPDAPNSESVIQPKDRPGYHFVTIHLFDPTDNLVSPYI